MNESTVTENHGYGGVAATKSVVTDFGTFHICAACVSHLPHDHFKTRPVDSENQRQRCQCEHADHFSSRDAHLGAVAECDLHGGER